VWLIRLQYNVTMFRWIRSASQYIGVVGLLLGFSPSAGAWSPGVGSSNAVQNFSVNFSNRTDVLAFYNCIYYASAGYTNNIAWTGNVGSCVPGTISATFKDDVRRRVNFYRALGALPADITFTNATKNSNDQDAALIFSRNNQISHTPTNTLACWTVTGTNAALNSNIALGTYGPGSVDAYMRDDGANNLVVGHRRWIMYSRAQDMNTGDIPFNSPFNAANALWVIGDFKAAPTPQFVAWPNRGYVPFPLVPARWSLSYPGANFSNTTVTMTLNGDGVATSIISSNQAGVGDSTLVWTPTNLPSSLSTDMTYSVTVAGITGAGVPASYNYTVTLFDPAVLGDAVVIVGTNQPATTGASYTFNSIDQADAYQLLVSTGNSNAWLEGAEDAPPPQIQQDTTGAYTLRQTSIVRTGAKAFQLAFPDFNDQSFTITRDLIPTASSQLQFYDRGRFAATTTTLNAEVTTDGGSTWTNIWSRPGVGLSSAFWDPAFISRSVSLAAFTNTIIQIRFALRQNGSSIVLDTSANSGFFIDDITVTNATQLITPTTTVLASNAASFNLNATTAGAALTDGTIYYMRIRPSVGLRWYLFGATKVVTAKTATGYSNWIATLYPSVTGGVTGDDDQDGFLNGVEYAFNFNPTVGTPAAALPQPTLTGGSYSTSFAEPAGIVGVVYGAEWSSNLVNWITIADTGTGTNHIFNANVTGQSRAFFRHKINVTP